MQDKMSSAGPLRCELATEDDMDELIDLWFAAWANTAFHDAVWGKDTPANRRTVTERFAAKWRSTRDMFVLKGIDAATNRMVSFCFWQVVGPHATREEALHEDPVMSCDWLQGHERDVARQFLIPPLEMRWEVMRGRPFLLLMYLSTVPDARRRGAAHILVEWGQAKAASLGMPAYCEASDMGLNLYLKCGFQQVAMVKACFDGKVVDACPALKWDPPAK